MPLNKWAAFYKENSVDIIYYYSQKSHNKRMFNNVFDFIIYL